ncbi:MAG TPA: hypothetical protein VG942_08490 [Hyphomonadaceae bacterium]|nr:hypothetical protein [Hyphomonadaceae bacterium]
MPDERVTSSTSSSSGNGFLYFAIGALIVAVGVLGYMFYNGGLGNSSQDRANSAIERTADAVGDAAKDLGSAAKDAAHNVPVPAPAQPTPTAPQTAPAQNPG